MSRRAQNQGAARSGTRASMGHIPLFVLVLLATACMAFLLLLPFAGAEEVTWGNTNVSDLEEYSDLVINLDGNLTVDPGGALTIRDSVIAVGDASPSTYTISVEEGGDLVLVNVSITPKGGSFAFIVRGIFTFERGLMEGLQGHDQDLHVPAGLVVTGNGEAALTDVDVESELGVAVFADGSATVTVTNGSLLGHRTVLSLNGTSTASLNGTVVRSSLVASLVHMVGLSSLSASGCTFSSGMTMGSSVRDQAIRMSGEAPTGILEGCTVSTTELAEATGGYLRVLGCVYLPRLPGLLPDLLAEEAFIDIQGIHLDEVNISGGITWLYDADYREGEVRDGAVMNCVGSMPPLSTLSGDVTLNMYYWVDFNLLNATGVAVGGLDLNILTSTGVLVLETVSEPDGWVRKVPIASWTMKGDVFGYEPSHKVEFAGPEYQISNLQVFDNATIRMEDLPDSRDLALSTSSVRPSSSAPREGRTFDIIVDGRVLIPYPWQSGQTFIDLYIDGTFKERQVVSLSSRADVRFRDLSLAAGQHSFRVVVDPTNDVKEVNEAGNNEVRLVLDVASGNGGTGELMDLTIELTRSVDSEGNEGNVLLPGVVFISYEARATGATTWPRDVTVTIEVGGSTYDTERIDLLTQDGPDFIHRGQLELNLPRGEYTLTIIIDPDDEIDEEFEQNNRDSMVLTLDPDLDGGFDLDPACCSAIAMVAMVFSLFVINAYAAKRQREASAEMVAETVGYPESGYGTRIVHAPVDPRPPGKTPIPLDQRWRADQMDKSMEAYYASEGMPTSSADRILGYQTPSAAQRGRYKATNLKCPRCGGNDIMVFPDSSSKCQACKKIFYPRRR